MKNKGKNLPLSSLRSLRKEEKSWKKLRLAHSLSTEEKGRTTENTEMRLCLKLRQRVVTLCNPIFLKKMDCKG
jgi:hypothetical protein